MRTKVLAVALLSGSLFAGSAVAEPSNHMMRQKMDVAPHQQMMHRDSCSIMKDEELRKQMVEYKKAKLKRKTYQEKLKGAIAKDRYEGYMEYSLLTDEEKEKFWEEKREKFEKHMKKHDKRDERKGTKEDRKHEGKKSDDKDSGKPELGNA